MRCRYDADILPRMPNERAHRLLDSPFPTKLRHGSSISPSHSWRAVQPNLLLAHIQIERDAMNPTRRFGRRRSRERGSRERGLTQTGSGTEKSSCLRFTAVSHRRAPACGGLSWELLSWPRPIELLAGAAHVLEGPGDASAVRLAPGQIRGRIGQFLRALNGIPRLTHGYF